ncbi:iron chaperone [Alicyclobacillus fodiniaquatilis]|uniref:Iron chaperone n=1 Tax=Alicyclobacillus fodiniaquatilis TaxID=1661150 RepID=A0ABW4JF85_9BACL
MSVNKPSNIDEYISGFPVDVQTVLEEIRSIITDTIPEAEESISYGMPTYILDGKTLIHFAAHKKHIGLYPVPTDGTFEKEFLSYKTTGRGTIQFPFGKPIPKDLIAEIAAFRAEKIRK